MGCIDSSFHCQCDNKLKCCCKKSNNEGELIFLNGQKHIYVSYENISNGGKEGVDINNQLTNKFKKYDLDDNKNETLEKSSTNAKYLLFSKNSLNDDTIKTDTKKEISVPPKNKVSFNKIYQNFCFKKTFNEDKYFRNSSIDEYENEQNIDELLNQSDHLIEQKYPITNHKFRIKNRTNTYTLESDNPEIDTVLSSVSSDSSITFSDSDFKKFSMSFDNDEIKSLGINIGSFKTVYSLFSKINGNFVSKVLLMNNNSRVIPSIFSYTKNHRLFGENCQNIIIDNLNSSYNNLSRIIGFDNKIKVYEDELNFEFLENENINNLKFYCRYDNVFKEIQAECVLADFIMLINKYYFKKEKYYYSSTFISVPDFYSAHQKEYLRLICESLNMEDVNLFNESSAITMYYGYTKYNDNFIKDEIVDENITKNILFIDSGHSKTSFILSEFKYNQFKVNYVICLPHIGGRNFDNLILNYCITKFLKIKKIKKDKFKLTPKMKFRLNEEIKKARENLSIYSDYEIFIGSFYQEENLVVTVSRDKFEELIKNYINEFDINLNKIIQYSKDKNIIIDNVEISGELMKTPIFQKLIEEKNLVISKSLFIDECCSVGAALLGNYINEQLPIENFQYFYNYNYFNIEYEITQIKYSMKKKIFLEIGSIKEKEKNIVLSGKNAICGSPIHIKFYYCSNNNNDIKLYTENLLLKHYVINLFDVFKLNKIQKKSFIVFKIRFDDAQLIYDEQLVYNDKKLFANIEVISGTIYKTYNEEIKFKKNIYDTLKQHKNYDLEYDLFVNKKTGISNFISDIKSKIEKVKNLYGERKKLQDLEKAINKIVENEEYFKLQKIQIELRDIVYNILCKLLEILYKENNENNNEKIQKLCKMRNNLMKNKNNFNFKKFIDYI